MNKLLKRHFKIKQQKDKLLKGKTNVKMIGELNLAEMAEVELKHIKTK